MTPHPINGAADSPVTAALPGTPVPGNPVPPRTTESPSVRGGTGPKTPRTWTLEIPAGRMREPVLAITNGKRASGDSGPISTSEASDEAACFMLYREQHELIVVARFTVDGEPVSKARARFTKQGSKTQAYTPEKTLQAEQIVGWKFRAAAKGHRLDPETAYGVMALFFCGTRQRRDVDNMLKLVLDGLNGVAWPDDAQVSEVSARKTLTLPANARTEVLVYEVGPVQRFTSNCEHCGKEFSVYPSTVQRQRFCSKSCHDASRRKQSMRPCASCRNDFYAASSKVVYCSPECRTAGRTAEVTCTQCGRSFSKSRSSLRSSGNHFCNQECMAAWWRPRRAKSAQGTCVDCGGPTSKKSYERCQACSFTKQGAKS